MNSFVLQLILLLLLIVNYQNYCLACKGCVQLDEYNFDKVIKRFKIALIKFDVSYPYGDKHEIFTKLADELKTNDNIIIGEIGIKDYGEHDNQKFAEQLGITKDNLPTLRLIINNNDDDITIIKTITNRDEWSVDNLRNLIRDNTHLYIGLPGCLEKYDKIAVDFIQMKNVEQMTIVERIEKEAVEIDDKNVNKIKVNHGFYKWFKQRLTFRIHGLFYKFDSNLFIFLNIVQSKEAMDYINGSNNDLRLESIAYFTKFERNLFVFLIFCNQRRL